MVARRCQGRRTAWVAAAAAFALLLALSVAPVASARVLRVGTWHGIRGQYSSVQAAVRAAHQGDWVLIGPGDYHETGIKGASEPAGVLVRTARLHIRGMDRNRVTIDGTKRGAARCSGKKADQVFTKDGRDGLMVLKKSGGSVENLTVCNYLTGNKGGEGNEIWWNGGDGSGRIGLGSFRGDYLTATATYSNGTDDPRGEYGIFTSNSRGPGVIDHSYASNMGDAAYYIGACPNCNQVLRHAHGQFSALGYSGTNSGGNLILERNEFDHNKTGITTNSQNNDDAPGPQNGACPGGAAGPLGVGICTVFRDNFVHDNNNPNVPGNGAGGLAGGAPIGTGIILAGTRYDAVQGNRVEHNGAWGVLVDDLPDQEAPPPISHCEGGTYTIPPGTPGQDPICFYQAFGNRVIGNAFRSNGSFGNPTNGDILLVTTPHDPGNCFSGNTDPAGLSEDPPGMDSNPAYNNCSSPNGGDLGDGLIQAECASQLLGPCPLPPSEASYPRAGKVTLHMAAKQATMPDPCRGVPSNPWCRARNRAPAFTG